MPIYEYRCDACSNEFEILVLRRNETVRCPACGGDRLTKLISAHAVGQGSPEPACGADACAPACGSGGCPACE